MKIYLLIPLLALLLTSCIEEEEKHGNTDFELKAGDTLPRFSVERNDGFIVNTHNFQGKIGVIILFNTSCPDCRKELPVVQAVYDEYKDSPSIEFLCISRAEQSPSIEKFWKANAITLPYSAQSNTAIFNLFAGHTIPRIYITDKDLTIFSAYDDNPLVTADEIRNDIRLLLNK